jgi:hypothetical protein
MRAMLNPCIPTQSATGSDAPKGAPAYRSTRETKPCGYAAPAICDMAQTIVERAVRNTFPGSVLQTIPEHKTTQV